DVARDISAFANAGDIVVSRAVKDLVTGSGIPFVDPPARRGASRIEGIELFLVESNTAARAPRHSLVGGSPSGANRARPREILTRHQRTVLELVAQGMSNKEIARLMRLSEHTIHRHMANIFN